MTLRDPDPQPSGDNLALAVGAIVFSVFALSLGDALIKLTSNSFALWQIFVLRSLLATPALVLIWRLYGRRASLWPKHLFWTLVRSLMLVGMWVIYYGALPHLQLPVAAAAFYTLPFFITLFSAVLLGDRISRQGWLAVGIGFAGILLILKPDAGDFNTYALKPLLSAMLYALAMILTRSKCRGENPMTLALALNLSFIAVGTVASLGLTAMPSLPPEGFMLSRWTEMNSAAWTTMGIMAAGILVGSLGAAIAYQKGPPAVVGIFDFAYVGFSVVWGVLIIGEVPSATAFAGIALITVAGVLSVKK
ncbi:DMT family transporter [uncultured Shimia sp.]|uniref:DMT family transporter n=1 Tax=uncultured Shimia sp. TaxID=573152 RepID=UPI0026249DDB|nr:DMT family transporter [uncultured Shimia sp.]